MVDCSYSYLGSNSSTTNSSSSLQIASITPENTRLLATPPSPPPLGRPPLIGSITIRPSTILPTPPLAEGAQTCSMVMGLLRRPHRLGEAARRSTACMTLPPRRADATAQRFSQVMGHFEGKYRPDMRMGGATGLQFEHPRLPPRPNPQFIQKLEAGQAEGMCSSSLRGSQPRPLSDLEASTLTPMALQHTREPPVLVPPTPRREIVQKDRL